MTQPLTVQERQPLGVGPGQGEAISVSRDVLWFRIVSPGAPLGGVNIWALRDGAGWVVVDTGFADPDSAAQWDAIIARLDGPITRILATHYHPDHIGQVGNLLRRFDVPLLMTEPEWEQAKRMNQPRDAASMARYADHLRRCGLPLAVVEQMASGSRGPFTSGLPDNVTVLRAGDRLELGGGEWVVSTAAGHSPAPAMFENSAAGLQIVGDQLLMRITPHIGIEPGDTDSNSDPLGEYFTFLQAASAARQDMLALPGHGPAFTHSGLRAAEIAAHHHDRLNVLSAALDTPTTVMGTIETMFGRPLKGVGLLMGLSEALAHLQHLVRQGRATREIDAEGQYRFVRSGADLSAAAAASTD